MIAIIDSRTPEDICSSLSSFGYDLLMMPKCNRLAEPVSAHPDMRLFILGKKNVSACNSMNIHTKHYA